MSASGWIGVDLDGTLAHYDGWNGAGHIGIPVPLMVQRVKDWLAQGVTVKVFTARAFGDDPEAIAPIKAWCQEHIGQELEVTCVKDFAMIELWDDRAVSVKLNTGLVLGGTGQYPDGRIDDNDEGALEMLCTVRDGVLCLDFNKEVGMIGFDPASAENLAKRLAIFVETGC